MTEGEAIYNCSLMSIEEYLRSAENIYVVGNLDDPILSGDEVKFLQDVFGDKAYFFEHGGHCGNMMYAPYVRRMLEFTGEVQQ
jgi:predicted alpha/beta hydrolase family esterase